MNRAILFLLVLSSAVFAQTNRGEIKGTVTDASSSVVPHAKVQVVNVGTNQTRTVTTATDGSYSVVDLDPVLYKVSVESNGFRKSIVENVKVDTASQTTVNVTLQTGAVATEVTVSAAAPLVNTENGTVSSTINERQIQDVPLVNRSVLDLAVVLPNVSGDPGSENPAIVSVTSCPGCNLSVNGGRPLSTLLLADGVNNTGVSLARTMVSFSPETVQEFTVQTSAYSAEYGTSGGGVINATTKSGTNSLVGTLLWYNRNPAFAAAPFTLAAANRPIATLKYNSFSASAGGPIYIPKIYNGKDKSFWFAAFEPNYRRDKLDQYGLLPTDAMRGGDFSGVVNTPSGYLPVSVVQQFQSIAPNAVTVSDGNIYQQFNLTGNQFTPITLAAGGTYAPFPGNVIPKSFLDTTAQKALKYLVPAGSYYLNSNGLISNVYSPRVLKQDQSSKLLRIDQIVTSNNHINGRFSSTPIVKTQSASISPLSNSADYSYAKQAMLADTHSFSPSLINDLRLNYTRGRFSSTTAPEYDAKTGANLNTEFGLPNITAGGVPGFNALFPGSALGGGGSTATGIGGGGSTNNEDKEERYAITDILYKVHGKMSLKMGIDISHSLQNEIPLYAALGGQYPFSNLQSNSTSAASGTGGSPFASFLLGVPNASVTLRPALIPYYYRWNAGAAFFQDDWRIRPGLTLNLGVRYTLELPRTEKYDNQGVFRPDLATNVALATPVTLQDGSVLKSVLVPPFAFAGRGGNSRYLTKPQYLDFEPRFGFAWSPAFLRSHGVTLRGGYGISHAPVSGSFRLPQPDFGATQTFAVTTPSATANPGNILRLGENPPVLQAQTPTQVINAPANGLVTTNSLYYQAGVGAFAVSDNYHTPYIQNWNLTISKPVGANGVLEIGYTGLKGTHLFLSRENINSKNPGLLAAQLAQNISTTATVNDPLGRLNPSTGKILTVQNGSLGSAYAGFSSLYQLYDSSANSIRHGGYISFNQRLSHGLSFISNYTWAKSIDDASSAGGDKNVLTSVNGQVDGQVALGGTRRNDRAVSTYDQRHIVNFLATYDLPIGHGRALLAHSRYVVDALLGGWTVTGISRLSSGFPYIPTISDTNLLGDLTHTIRPNLTPGVPLINPYWTRNCPTGSNCQPYLNPSAFQRPALGELGNAPRTLDGIRGPWDQTFDVSVQKSFRIGESGKRRLQFRVDALNIMNHPIFRVFPNNAGGTDIFNSAPSTAALTAADYNTWATANNQPQSTTTAGTALLTQINAMVTAQKNAAGVLPLNFFAVPLPDNFYGKAAASYDITTLNGYKLFRLRQSYNTSGGDLYNPGQSRYIQFGVKLYF